MIKQRLSNLFKLRMYDVNDVMQYCIENNIKMVTNDLQEVPQDHEIKDLPTVWKSLLTLKPYDKYSK